MDFSYVISGFVVGATVGMTGVGGGSLMTPLLVIVFGIHPATAVGTDLLYAAFTKAGGAVAHNLRGSVDWRIVGRLATGSLPAAGLTLYILSQLGPATDATSKLITIMLGVALLLTAGAILFRSELQALAAARPKLSERTLTRATIASGAVLGILVSTSSVGAGALGAAVLVFLYPRLPALHIVGSDIAHAAPLTLVAGLGHWWLGNVDGALLASLLFGSLPGIFLGSHIAVRLSENVLRMGLVLMLVAVGMKLVTN